VRFPDTEERQKDAAMKRGRKRKRGEVSRFHAKERRRKDNGILCRRKKGRGYNGCDSSAREKKKESAGELTYTHGGDRVAACEKKKNIRSSFSIGDPVSKRKEKKHVPMRGTLLLRFRNGKKVGVANVTAESKSKNVSC